MILAYFFRIYFRLFTARFKYSAWAFCTVLLVSTEVYGTNNSDTLHPEPKKTLRNFMNPDSLASINFSLIPVPIVSSSPETGIRFGMSLDYFFNAKDKSKTQNNEARGSFLFGQITYSTLNQLDLMGGWQVFTKGEKWVLRGRAGYSAFEERIWGIGMNTVAEKDYWEFNYTRAFLESRFYRQLKNNWFAGISINYNNTFDVRFSKPLSPAFNYSDGVTGSTVLGIGPAILLETRDYPFSARQGVYLEAIYQHFLPVGSLPYAYQQLILDYRKFHPLGKENTIGYQLFHQSTTGAVPLRELPRVGSPALLRGFFGGRYRNKSLTALQGEYRFQVWRWIHASVFGAGGFNDAAVRDYHLPDLLFSGGGGLRFLVNKKNRMFVRMDYALNSTMGGAFYLRLNDAF